jgi:hypothetical protein
MAHLLAPDRRQKKAGRTQPVIAVGVTGEKKVGKNGHAGEKLYILKRPSNPDPDQFMGMQVGDPFAVEEDCPLLRPIEPGDAVEKTGLAGAVRTDDGEEFPGPDRHIDIAQRLYPSKMESETPDLQLRPP